MFGSNKKVEQRLRSLEQHLREENPLLVDAVKSYRQLDRIAYRMGLLSREQSYTTHIAWWPLVSVLGTYSAGKSTFINHYLQHPLQETGTQAVDDKFCVICYAGDDSPRVLPGIALDADPRFPFYQMSEELEKVTPGEGKRVDAYLRLKTCNSPALRGLLLIDSPGFDADAQRTATLRITDYIMDLSDLVLVFFDARHPESGTMQDTLKHLVANTVKRSDSSKFLYILNQIDSTAREDNPEDVFASWQRALAQEGLTAGKFYAIFSPDVPVTIPDESLRRRFETKRDEDLTEIHERIQQVGVERVYRIIGALEKTARQIEETVPRITDLVNRWAKGVLWRDTVSVGLLGLALVGLGLWAGMDIVGESLSWVGSHPWAIATAVVAGITAIGFLHYWARGSAARSVLKHIARTASTPFERDSLSRAFAKNSGIWHSVFRSEPVGWGRRTRRRLHAIVAEADRYVQTLNSQFANPSGPEPDEAGIAVGAEVKSSAVEPSLSVDVETSQPVAAETK
ncbi:MAG: dynamin family protein [Gammaproteobacteria bacterium SG8_47]|nr:MAG: dynamin family protein [Gammaproteobacteria bacterium SG8_47]